MPNPYHDSTGRFTTRNGQLANIQRAIRSGDFASYEAEREALEAADLKANYLGEVTMKTVLHPALKDSEAEIIAREELLIEGSREEIEAYVTERTERPEFIDLLNQRDETRERAKRLKDEYTFRKEYAEKDPEYDYDLVREKGFELLDTYEELQVFKAQANAYKDITAPAAARLSEILEGEAKQNGTWKEYTEDTLNDLEATVEVQSGSREWLEQRQKGIGGSDVGKIIKVYDSGRGSYQEAIDSKLREISDEEVEEQALGHTEYKGATGRGNAWEQLIAHKFAENNPDAGITYCKTSWQNKNVEYQFANFDGLMTDENGKPNGILEIKTASDASKWGKPEDGLDGVPPGYRAQVLWYAQAAGFKKGAVAVMIDDREYREYHFEVTPELEAEAASNLAQVDTFVKEINSRKEGKPLPPAAAPRKGFGATLIRETIRGKNKRAFTEAAAWREETPEQTQKRFQEICQDPKNPEEVTKALTQLYSEKDPSSRKANFINIDLETSGTTPTSGRIIEVGISVRNPSSGEEVSQFSQLYGLPRKVIDSSGTGAVEVHGITAGKIAKKRQFRHPEEQKKVLDTLKSGIMVSHNANFERTWLRQHLDGYAEAERKGEIKIIDTMYLTQRFLPDTKSNKLEAFCEKFGVPYKDAHRAYNDASMMGIALHRFASFLHKNPEN